MGRYKKILVAYDGSASARSALIAAGKVAEEENSWLKVVAVVPVYKGDLELAGVSQIKETIAGPGKKILSEAKTQAEEIGLHILTDLEQGEPYERIVHIADDEKCDLIVMGRRGISHLERELMGGVTARVIGHTKRDVLVVPEGASLAWNRILVSTDGSPKSEAAVDLALRVAKAHSSKLTVMTVVYTNDEFLALAPSMVTEMVTKAKAMIDMIQQKAEDAGVETAGVVKEGEPYKAITTLAGKIQADVIIMGSHGRRGLSKILMGSVTERTIGYSPCPVLIRHPEAATRVGGENG
jgi:nucleotide-binding universal stress UspA family protein